jgi:WD40 repeat protein
VIDAVAFDISSNGGQLVTARLKGTVELWNLTTGRPLGKPLHHNAPVTYVAFSSNDEFIVTNCDDRAVRVWDIAAEEL